MSSLRADLHPAEIVPLPVSLLTGFLGAGKTTLLSRLLKDPDSGRLAVIINEFGAVSLDHDLIESSDESDVIELQGGCLCCTIQGDLSRTIRGLYARMQRGGIPAFERVVIETTGLADPAPILKTIITDPMIAECFRLDGVITVVDGINGAATLDRHPEAQRQVGVADRIVLSKTGDLDADAVTALEARVQTLNPGVPIVRTESASAAAVLEASLYDPVRGRVNVADWLRDHAFLDAQEHEHDHDHDHQHQHGHHHDHHHDVNRHSAAIRADCHVADQPMPFDRFLELFNLLQAHAGENMLRVKGIFHIAERPEQPLVIHGVQHVFHPLVWLHEWPSPDRRCRLVAITQDLDPTVITKLFKSLAG